MKKFFKIFFWIIIFAGVIYFLYSSIMIVPREHAVVLYSKFNGKFKVLQKPFNIILYKGIPHNAIIKKYPLQHQDFLFVFKKKLTLLDKDIDLLKYKVITKYNLDMEQYQYLFDHFNSMKEVNSSVEEQFDLIFQEKVNHAIESEYNLNTYPETAEKEVFEILKERLKTRGINIISLRIINIDLIPRLNYKQVKELVDQSFKYEENFKLDIRKIELEKIRLIKEAENEVEYLKIIGEYIKENPLILKFMMIKKVDENDVIFVPSGEIGFDFSDSLRSGFRKKLEKKEEQIEK